MDRRQAVEDRQAELMQQTFNLFPERWDELYREDVLGAELGAYAPEEEIPLTESDLDQMDAFLARQEQGALKRWARAGALPGDFELDSAGVRV